MRFVRVGVVAVLFTAFGIAVASAASADCAGPGLSVGEGTAEVARGQVITVSGIYWGDSCYDTGPPPQGVGPLGRPVDDIDVVIEQDGADLVVASGAAEADYTFRVSIEVPSGLRPGEARVFARSASASSVRPGRSLTISAAPPPGSSGGVVHFGPGSAPDTSVAAAAPNDSVVGPSAPVDDESNLLVRGFLGVVAVGAIAGVAFLVVRRRPS